MKKKEKNRRKKYFSFISLLSLIKYITIKCPVNAKGHIKHRDSIAFIVNHPIIQF